jgi:hypothetical protein
LSSPGLIYRADPGLIAAAGLGMLFFFAITGGTVLDPRNIEWLLRRPDPSTAFLGWQFFSPDAVAPVSHRRQPELRHGDGQLRGVH